MEKLLKTAGSGTRRLVATVAAIAASIVGLTGTAEAKTADCGTPHRPASSRLYHPANVTASGVSCANARTVALFISRQIFGYPLPGYVYYPTTQMWRVAQRQVTDRRYEDPVLRVTVTRGRRAITFDLGA